MKAFTRVLLLTCLATPAYADETHKPTETPKTVTAPKPGTAQQVKLTKNELQILAHYHELNLLEIELGKLASKRATTPAVKSYGEMLVMQHGASDKQLKDLAKKTRQVIPRAKPATDAEKQEKAETKKQVAALKKLKGVAFEREYLRMMVDGHEKELAKVDGKLAEAQNPDLIENLRAKKPVLQAHADAARELQKSNAQASR